MSLTPALQGLLASGLIGFGLIALLIRATVLASRAVKWLGFVQLLAVVGLMLPCLDLTVSRLLLGPNVGTRLHPVILVGTLGLALAAACVLVAIGCWLRHERAWARLAVMNLAGAAGAVMVFGDLGMYLRSSYLLSAEAYKNFRLAGMLLVVGFVGVLVVTYLGDRSKRRANTRAQRVSPTDNSAN